MQKMSIELEMRHSPDQTPSSESDLLHSIVSSFEGDKDEDGLRNGKGVLKYTCSNGSPMHVTLDGEWKDNLMHGHGALYINGVEIYAGTWLNGHIALSTTVDVEEESRKGGCSRGRR